ncbi:MAG: hypothetical protein LBU94_05670, partial [Clostridiales bacterium]|nr:hypothetical protein [Clostridiales bacterium]
VYNLTRGFAAPSGISDEALATLEKCVKDFTQTEEWKAYVEANSLTEIYMNSEAFTAFCAESTAAHEVYLEEMGLIAQ